MRRAAPKPWPLGCARAFYCSKSGDHGSFTLISPDLANAVGFDTALCLQNIQSVRPGMPVLKVSAKTGQGIDEWREFMESRLTAH